MFLDQYVGLNVKVDTIDAVHGNERSIVIISLTRSNSNRTVGLLREDNRINVSFTCAKHLQIVIEDFSTLSSSRLVSHLYKEVLRGATGTTVNFHVPVQ